MLAYSIFSAGNPFVRITSVTMPAPVARVAVVFRGTIISATAAHQQHEGSSEKDIPWRNLSLGVGLLRLPCNQPRVDF